MGNKCFVILATTYYPEGKITVVDGMSSTEEQARITCELLNKNYKKERSENKLLPKVVWTYAEV